MSKHIRQSELIRVIAREPWQHTKKSLAQRLETSEATLQRDLDELAQKEYEFEENEEQGIFLRNAGWLGHTPLKEASLRQMEILELLQSTKRGLTVTDIEKRVHSGAEGETGEKTVERMVKDLTRKGLVVRQGNEYRLNLTWILPPLQLTEREKQVFYEALKVAKALSPLPELIPALEAKLKLSIPPKEEVETVFVQGRTPSHNLRRIHVCNAIEQAARTRQVITILYRRGEAPAWEVRVHPLGIVYYWVLDKWYLVAEYKKEIRTYAVDQILHLDLEEEHFELVPEFDLKDCFRFSWGVYRNTTQTPVKIRFYAAHSTVLRVREELQGRETCRIVEDEEGLLVTDCVEGIEEIAVWLRGFGPSAEVLEPPELRAKMRTEWARMADYYAKEEKNDLG